MIDLDAIRANAADSKRRIGEMCANLRPPKMSIPVSPNDDDEFICRTLDDLLAYVDALRSRLAERDRQVDKWARFSESHGWLDAQEFTEWIAYLQRRLAEAELSRDSWKREAELNQQAADESANYAAQLAEAERNEGTLLGMIRHQRDVLRECLPYLNESMAGRRPGRSADDIRASVKALTADSATPRENESE